jgi:uncharacterized membrane protein YhfC
MGLFVMILFELTVMLGAPVVLVWYLHRRYGALRPLVVAGAVAFVASQVVHLPLNVGLTALFRLDSVPTPPEAWMLPFNAVVLGLTAGLCEETARFLVYRLWVKDAHTWRQALMVGAGHGGVESMFIGLLVAVNLVVMMVMRSRGASALGALGEASDQIVQAMNAYWDTPFYMPLLAALERLMAVLMHLALSALVLHGVVRGRLWTLAAAIVWHAACNAIAVYVQGTWGPLAAEGALALASIGSAFILWATWRADRDLRTDSVSVPG